MLVQDWNCCEESGDVRDSMTCRGCAEGRHVLREHETSRVLGNTVPA